MMLCECSRGAKGQRNVVQIKKVAFALPLHFALAQQSIRSSSIYTSNGVIINISSHYILRSNQCSRLIGEMEIVKGKEAKSKKVQWKELWFQTIVEGRWVWDWRGQKSPLLPLSCFWNKSCESWFSFCDAFSHNANTRTGVFLLLTLVNIIFFSVASRRDADVGMGESWKAAKTMSCEKKEQKTSQRKSQFHFHQTLWIIFTLASAFDCFILHNMGA